MQMSEEIRQGLPTRVDDSIVSTYEASHFKLCNDKFTKLPEALALP